MIHANNLKPVAFKVGQQVTIHSGITSKPLTALYAHVERVSPTGRVITVNRADYRTASRFYLSASGWRYVQNPGSGIAGALNNDYIRAEG